MSQPKVHNRAGGHFFMSEHTEDPVKAHEGEVPMNSLVYAICKTICNVMALPVEAELSTLFINAKKG
eukprot:14383730-Ditylum_brightwellii.AAC.1